MEKVLQNLKFIVSILGTVFTFLFGAWDTALGILILFMILDYITGLIKGYVTKELSSDIGLHGLARKSVILIVLIVAVALDRLLGNGNWLFRTLVAYFYIANEGLSILENCGTLGLPVPQKILDALAQLKEGKE